MIALAGGGAWVSCCRDSASVDTCGAISSTNTAEIQRSSTSPNSKAIGYAVIVWVVITNSAAIPSFSSVRSTAAVQAEGTIATAHTARVNRVVSTPHTRAVHGTIVCVDCVTEATLITVSTAVRDARAVGAGTAIAAANAAGIHNAQDLPLTVRLGLGHRLRHRLGLWGTKHTWYRDVVRQQLAAAGS